MASIETVTMPPAPRTLEETGVSGDLVLQLVSKMLHLGGELAGTELASQLGVRFAVVEPALDLLKRERHCEISGGATLGAPSYRYRLTDAGRIRAALFLEHNQYAGPLPVPIDQYVSYMREFGLTQSRAATRESIRRAFAHLVLSDRVLDQLGPAVAARHSLFLYGPPGNGKTVISQAIRNIFTGHIAIPHALAVDNHIIRLFDPVNHEPVGESESAGLVCQSDVDARWIRCRRPAVTAGGELTLEALELGLSPAGFYRAPLQALANGGVLVIDDFGRQHVSARDLLNRWIVPLESRVDYLTLQTGQKFPLPFETFVVFATNLKPADLLDEAFLRRIQYKVFAESPTEGEFIEIFEHYCRAQDLEPDRSLVEALLEIELRPRGVSLRGCQPRDLIDHALSLAAYLDRPRALTPELLAEAAETYFVHDRDVALA